MASYTMPNVEVGDSVLWHIEGNTRDGGHAAIVKSVADRHVDLEVFIPNRQPVERINVRHVDDPYLTEDENPRMKREHGGWDFSLQTKRLMAVENALTDAKKSRTTSK